MTAKQFARQLEQLELSPPAAARALGVRVSTVYRWLAGDRKIPGPVEAALICWIERKGKP